MDNAQSLVQHGANAFAQRGTSVPRLENRGSDDPLQALLADDPLQALLADDPLQALLADDPLQ
ncbi:MAG TPA: hypothetical protein PLJ78_02615, partial [Anaerolineae bacterium]|nr:hypothetical protein [Anaerolineae bacterium]